MADRIVLDECDRDSAPYLHELGVEIVPAPQNIRFSHNATAPVHRWSPYVQGFSGQFVSSTLDRYARDYDLFAGDAPLVHDPFAGSGTVLVEAKRQGVRRCTGTELNPLLAFLANAKLSNLDLAPNLLLESLAHLRHDATHPPPAFLKSEQQFDAGVLANLQRLRGAIEHVQPAVRDLFLVAFAAILIDCSRLRRSPCLGYHRDKLVSPEAPWVLFRQKIEQIAADLGALQSQSGPSFRDNDFSDVIVADARQYRPRTVALAITSPPYMNGLDYVMNYKIEMAWLGFTANHRQAKAIKDSMVACDNISKGVTDCFASRGDKFGDPWLDDIICRMTENIADWDDGRAEKRIARRRPAAVARRRYRREDMPTIVHKYFDDLHQVTARIAEALIPGGRFVLVLGDSYIADVYLPTDLLLAKMSTRLGLRIERIEKARRRRSGQIQSYRLRETVVTLRKD